jgi:hypothetical protein
VPKTFITLPEAYSKAIVIANPFFKDLFEFENILKLTIHKYLSMWDDNWWENSLKHKKSEIYKYVDDLKKKKSNMPWIGDSAETELYEIHHVTLGQLEEIVKTYKSECIPEIFPTLDFFTGHMLIIKKVRNLFAHMHPCISQKDISTAKREMHTLNEHLFIKYDYWVNGN